ncbi:phosphate acyltransferase PlsX [Agaricicola taiwanensis]|nr:phosphate acyltransferase PlsX [Agaricicola taiwanensis]
MSKTVRIALDVMGGDSGAPVVIAGADLARERHPDASFILFGDEAIAGPILSRHPKLAAVSRISHTDVAIKMDDKPSQALRYGRKVSSMWQAVDAVRTGDADVVVSAGNTGALMAMAKVNLKSMTGIERPAIAAMWPTMRGESIVLDVGATIGADAQQLVDFAVMGGAMARIVFDIERPTVGLLNIGVEEMKGVESIREAGQHLKAANYPDIDYRGFVESDDIGKGTVDVVVTEGFSGNIALKAAEGTARQIGAYLRAAMNRTWRAKLGYLLAKPAFDALKEKMDPRKVNGGVFLGLNGIVVKSHGGTDAEGFASAIDVGHEMVRYALLEKITAGLSHAGAARQLAVANEVSES